MGPVARNRQLAGLVSRVRPQESSAAQRPPYGRLSADGRSETAVKRLTDRLWERFGCLSLDGVPADVIAVAHQSILDWFGCALAGPPPICEPRANSSTGSSTRWPARSSALPPPHTSPNASAT